MSEPEVLEEVPVLETAHQTPDTAADSYEAAIDDAIATCNSDMRGALRALLIANEVLETELAKLRHLQHVARKHERKAAA